MSSLKESKTSQIKKSSCLYLSGKRFLTIILLVYQELRLDDFSFILLVYQEHLCRIIIDLLFLKLGCKSRTKYCKSRTLTCKSRTKYCKSRTHHFHKATPGKGYRDFFYLVTYINYSLTYLTYENLFFLKKFSQKLFLFLYISMLYVNQHFNNKLVLFYYMLMLCKPRISILSTRLNKKRYK